MLPSLKEVTAGRTGPVSLEKIQAANAADLFKKYDRSGNLDIPTLLVHTIYDQLITPSMAVAPIENMAQLQGKHDNPVVLNTNRQVHCRFTSDETGRAFDILRQWVHTGKRPPAGLLD